MFFPLRDVSTALSWSPRSRLLGAVGERGFLVYDPKQRRRICRTPATEAVPAYGLTCLAWSPVERAGEPLLAVGGREGLVRLWQVTTAQPAGTYGEHSPEVLALPAAVYPHRRPISALAWSPDGQRLASAADDCTVRIWHADRGQTQAVIAQEPMRNGSLLAWLDASTLISNRGATIYVWEAHSGQVLRTIATKLAWDGRAFALSPSRQQLAVALGTSVTIYEVATGAICQTYHPRLPRCDASTASLPSPVAWSPDGRWLATVFACAQDRLFLWDVVQNETVHECQQCASVTCLDWADEHLLAWAGHGYLATHHFALPAPTQER